MGHYGFQDLRGIEYGQQVGIPIEGEILDIFMADDQYFYVGNDQDFAQGYDSTAGQYFWRLPTVVAPNEPIINIFNGVIGETVTTPAAGVLANTENTVVVWGGTGAVASYTFIQGGIGVASGTTRYSQRANALGVDIDINVISPVIDIGADVLVSGTFIDISYDTPETTTGALDIINIFSEVNLLILGGDLTGIRFNFAETRVTPATDQDITILEGIFPAFTQSAANTTTYRGVEMITAGALIQDTAAGTINFYGLDLATPAMQVNFAAGVLNTAVIRSNTAGLINTDTAGTVTWYGFDLTTAEVDADSTGTTTVAGFNIGTAGALNQATGAGTINWYGSRIQMPVVTETTGTVTAYGHSVVLADIVSATATSPEVAGYHFTTPADTHSLAVEVTYRGLYGSAAGALVQDTAAGEIRWHGLDLVAPASTISFAASTIETAMFRVGTAGALASSTAGTHNWYGIDLVAPASTTTGTASTTITMFRIGTSGALEVNTDAGNTAWRGMHIISPAVTETTGDINVFGLDLDMDALVTTGGDIIGINAVMQGTYTTTGEMFMSATGDARQVQVLNTSNALLLSPTAAGEGTDIAFNVLEADTILLDFGIDRFPTGSVIVVGYDTAESSTGNVKVLEFTNANALTLGGDLFGVDLDFSTNVTTADNRDIIGYNLSLTGLAQTTAVTTNFKGFSIDTAGAISDSSTTAFNWYGSDFVLPAGTVTGTATMTIVGHRIGTSGALNTSTAAGFIDWYGMDIVTPAATAAGAFAQIIDISGFRIGTAGALNSNDALQATNWRGIDILMPQVATATGTTTVSGLYVQSFTGALLGTNYALNLDWRSTSGTITNIAFGNGAGTVLAGAVTGVLLNLTTNVTAGANAVIGADIRIPASSSATTRAIDIDYRATAGTIIEATFGAATTPTTAITGINLNMSSATPTDFSQTGFAINTHGDVINVTVGATYTIQNTITGGTVASSPGAAGTVTTVWRGLVITNPNATSDAIGGETAVCNIDGLFIQTGTSTLAVSGGTETINQRFWRFENSASAVMSEFIMNDGTIVHPTLRVYDNGGTDFIQFYDDDTTSWIVANPNGIALAPSNDVDDYILFSTIANVPGFASQGAADLAIQNVAVAALYDVTFFANQLVPAATPATGSTPEIRIYGWSSATINTQVFSTIRTSALNEAVAETGDEVAVMRIHPANNMLVLSESDNIEFTAGVTDPTLRIYGANGTVFTQMAGDGERLSISDATNTLFALTDNGLIDMNPRLLGAQVLIDIDHNGGVLTGVFTGIEFGFTNATTLGGLTLGMSLNLSTNVTNVNNQRIDGITINIPAAGTNPVTGITIASAESIFARGVYIRSHDSNTPTYNGAFVCSDAGSPFTGNMTFAITNNALIDMNPRTTGAATYLDITPAAVVLVGAPVGISVDLSATTMANINSTGFAYNLNPAVIHTTDTGIFTHQNTITGGAITVTPTPGAGAETTTANWYGTAITLPATLTATAAAGDSSTITANGLRIIGPPTQTLGGTGTESIRSACIYIDVSRASAANNFSIGIDFAGMAAGELVFAVPDDAQAVPNGGVALPANSTGRIAIDVGGTTRYIPYF